jgi:rhodanese-related sulfurtransferase
VKFITDNILLFAVAFASGALLLWPLLTRRAGGGSVTTTEATQLMNRENAVLVDVRSAEEYAKGHVAQAKNLPLQTLEKTPDAAGKKDKPLIVMCQNGQTSAKAAAALRKAGFTKVFALQGGLAGWQQAGLPTIKK